MLKIPALAYAFVAISATLGAAYDDISVKWPCPRYSPNGVDCPQVPQGHSLDADIGSPIGIADTYQSLPLCKHSTPWSSNSAVLDVSKPQTITFNADENMKGGGHCEFSVSYDGGDTFVVVHQVLDTCFLDPSNNSLVTSYTMDLPANLPSSKHAIFAWSYANSNNERVFYMNCADVEIVGSSDTTFTGKEMTIVNYDTYPRLPLASGNNAAGHEYYTNDAKVITVSAGTPTDAQATTTPEPAALKKRHYKTITKKEKEYETIISTSIAPTSTVT
ncbi:hypothetical protein LPJ78_005796, partial [Coemansia sp. RSA 989]